MSKPKKGKDGAIKPGTGRSEILFLHLMLRALDMGGRTAVIVPDGVLFKSDRAYVDTRRKLLEEHRLEGVISMPSGIFRPYSGVSTAVLLFTKGAKTERIWFYDMAHDGLSLDDKRQWVRENDIPDILLCWRERKNAAFTEARGADIERLKTELAPLKAERLTMQAEMNRLTFESVVAADGEEADGARALLETDQKKLDELNARIAPLQAHLEQLTRHFWVTKEQVRAKKYDLSASRYREAVQDEAYFETPQVTMERLLRLEGIMTQEVAVILQATR